MLTSTETNYSQAGLNLEELVGLKSMIVVLFATRQTVSIILPDDVPGVLQDLIEKLRYDLNYMETYREYTEAVYS
jgi:hypothetical protein